MSGYALYTLYAVVSSLLLILIASVQASEAGQVKTEGDLRDAIRRGEEVLLPMDGGTSRFATVSSPRPSLLATSGSYTARIELDGTLLAIEVGGRRVKAVTAARAAEIVFSEETGWPDHKTFNDSLYTRNMGSKLMFGEVVAVGDSVFASFMLAALFPSSHAQHVFSVGYFRLDQSGVVAGSLRAWAHNSSFAIRGHDPSAGAVCRVFAMRADKRVALTKRTRSSYSLVELASGKALAEGLPSGLVGIVGSDALFKRYDLSTYKYQLFVFNLNSLELTQLETNLPDVEAAVIGTDRALLMPALEFGSVRMYHSNGKRLVQVNVSAGG